MGDGRFSGGDRFLRRGIFVVIRAESRVIHADATDEGALAALVAESSQEIRGRDVDRSVVRRTGGAMGQRARDDSVVGRVSGVFVTVGALEREGIRFQPVEKSRGAKDAAIGVL